MQRMIRLDTRVCTNCHTPDHKTFFNGRKPMIANVKTEGFESGLNWDYVDKLKSITKMKLMVKGIETAEDAQLCLDHHVDGIIVSNHGGRASETGRGTLECLPEIVAVVNSRIPVLIDGGFRRGTDIFKALALGANAVCVGRPYIWGLASFGQQGVESVLKILSDELALTMRHAGVSNVKNINMHYLTA